MPRLFESIFDPRFVLKNPIDGGPLVGGVYIDAHRLTALSRYLQLSADLGDIPKEQAESIRGQIFDILFRAGYNPITEMEAYLREEKRRFPKLTATRYEEVTSLQTVPVPEYPQPEVSADPIQEWIDVQGGLDNVLKAIQKNGWADTSSWEKEGRKFTVADIKRLGKT